ncbi:unnamed protein product [Tilletia caries]|uniref:Uncharacterized protein n=1 Tax=Tilletia caries TaxID=13290 RepID=A0ABN7J0R8_9BASI|nr:unnamed protein product [Tilletia caries]
MALERAESRPVSSSESRTVSASSASSPGSSAFSAALGAIAPPVAAVSCLGHRSGTHRERRLDLLLGCAILNGFEPSFFFEDTEAQDSPLLGVGLSGDPWLEGVGKAGKQFTASKRLLDRVSGLDELHVPVAYSGNVVSHHRLRVGELVREGATDANLGGDRGRCVLLLEVRPKLLCCHADLVHVLATFGVVAVELVLLRSDGSLD